jgi:sulfoxide reductase catalytic subunit YedY
MSTKYLGHVLASDITSESVYRNRRHFLQKLAHMTMTTAIGMATPLLSEAKGIIPATSPASDPPPPTDFPDPIKSPLSTDEALTPFDTITDYSNFYEFGTRKTDPKAHAQKLITSPWSVMVVGAVEKPGMLNMEDILKHFSLEERIYRLRCVEGWSMVIPWIGFPLSQLLKRFQPTAKAKYVQFTSLHDPAQMPGQKRYVLNWPYVEGLRMDEAMHPLTILSVGLYGRLLPNENGAPIRLVVPWKYGFKSIKSIVKISLVEQEPLTSWVESDASEYGFYANVNPQVDHPRWRQNKERRLGDLTKRETLMFNGYAEQVASLYTGMDLKKQF